MGVLPHKPGLNTRIDPREEYEKYSKATLNPVSFESFLAASVPVWESELNKKQDQLTKEQQEDMWNNFLIALTAAGIGLGAGDVNVQINPNQKFNAVVNNNGALSMAKAIPALPSVSVTGNPVVAEGLINNIVYMAQKESS